MTSFAMDNDGPE